MSPFSTKKVSGSEMKEKDKQAITKTILAIVTSTAIGAVLLLGFPMIYMLIFFVVVLPASFILHVDPIGYSRTFVPIIYILGGISVSIPGMALNAFLMRKSSRAYKITSLILYILLLAKIAVLLSGYIYYQLHTNPKV
jgi:uncharacterized membrane-anchored protein